MRGARKRIGARPALWGLALTLVLTAGVAIAGQGAAPAEGEATAAADPAAETVASPSDPAREAEPGRWSYMRPRFAASGLRVHIDPQTGTPVTPPDKALRRAADLPAAFGRSHQGLEAVTLPNGYRYVDARGRLMSALAATVGEDGEVRVGHAPPAPAESLEGESGTAEAGEDRR